MRPARCRGPSPPRSRPRRSPPTTRAPGDRSCRADGVLEGSSGPGDRPLAGRTIVTWTPRPRSAERRSSSMNRVRPMTASSASRPRRSLSCRSPELPVPEAFVVTSDAFHRCLGAAGAPCHPAGSGGERRPRGPRRAAPLDGAHPDHPQHRLTQSVRDEILGAYGHLSATCSGGGAVVPVAVRSSVPSSSSSSFAGVTRSCTSVLGGPDVVRRIVDCWASNVSRAPSCTGRGPASAARRSSRCSCRS